MSETILIGGNNGDPVTGTSYFALFTGENRAETSESDAQVTFRSPGTLKNLFIRVATNSGGSATTVRVRKNGANGNQSVSIPAATTGVFEDVTNSDIVAVGDRLDYQVIQGGGTATYRIFSNIFVATTDTTIRAGTAGSFLTGFDSNTGFMFLIGRQGLDLANEPVTRLRNNVVGTIKNLFMRMEANARTTATTFRIRKNAANSNLIISIPALATGIFEDLTNTEAVAVGDDLNYSLTWGGGGGQQTYNILSFDFITTNRQFLLGASQGTFGGDGVVEFTYIAGAMDNEVPESIMKMKTRLVGDISRLAVYLRSNSESATSTFDLRVNEVTTALGVSIPGGQIGLFEDTTSIVTVTDTDDVSYRVSALGFFLSIAVQSVAARFTVPIPVPPVLAASKKVTSIDTKHGVTYRGK